MILYLTLSGQLMKISNGVMLTLITVISNQLFSPRPRIKVTFSPFISSLPRGREVLLLA